MSSCLERPADSRDVDYSFKSVTIPQRDDPRLASLARRCESCRPMGMFRSSENEFLLCYDGTHNSFDDPLGVKSHTHNYSHVRLTQSSASTSIDTETQTEPTSSSSGKAPQSASRSTLLMSLSSTRDSSRSGTSTRAASYRSFGASTCVAYGTGGGRRSHRSARPAQGVGTRRARRRVGSTRS